jgi:hypothetical protein
MPTRPFLLLCVCACVLPCAGSAGTPAPAGPARSGNPVLPGWYADPEAHVFAGEYWI